jgi:MraZ protein
MSDITGDFVVSLDSQGRLAIPLKHRIAMQISDHDKMIITRGVETCLQGFNIQKWEQYKKEIHSKANDSPATKRWLNRGFFGKAHDVSFDKQGRITVPAELLKFAQLTDVNEVTVVGCDDFIEIWNPKLLAEGSAEQEAAVIAAMNTPTVVSASITTENNSEEKESIV